MPEAEELMHYLIKVHSELITTLELSENNATFTGTARVNKQSGYTFTVYVEDNGEPGWKKGDKFDISIFDPAGSKYYAVNGTLEKGNIQIYASAELPMTEQPIEFDASESYDPDENIVTYRWDFDGDGVWDIEGDVVKITHSYNESGSYTVILEVEDTDGATNQTTITVHINDEEGEGISGDVTWNGKHTFDLEMTHIGSFPMITATAYEIVNTVTANVTVELCVDGVRMNETSETLTPGEHDISITAVWAPMSSGMHFISLHVRHVDDYNNWVGPTNDPTTEGVVFIKRVA
ncbi:MAG: PKD domain-containing protein [archaeon]|nr:PKD domain-containing protein [archaeon]